jgi:hypothetical protein
MAQNRASLPPAGLGNPAMNERGELAGLSSPLPATPTTATLQAVFCSRIRRNP